MLFKINRARSERTTKNGGKLAFPTNASFNHGLNNVRKFSFLKLETQMVKEQREKN